MEVFSFVFFFHVLVCIDRSLNSKNKLYPCLICDECSAKIHKMKNEFKCKEYSISGQLEKKYNLHAVTEAVDHSNLDEGCHGAKGLADSRDASGPLGR